MPESKYKKEKILKGFRCFSIALAIFWTIFLIYILISEHYAEYYRIHLSQVDASIPNIVAQLSRQKSEIFIMN